MIVNEKKSTEKHRTEIIDMVKAHTVCASQEPTS